MNSEPSRPKQLRSSLPGRTVQPPRRATRGAVAYVLFLWFLLFNAHAPAQSFKEYDLKAAYLYNFTQFVDWPAEAFAAPDSPLVIGVLGDDPFGKTLDAMVTNEVVKNRKLMIQRYRRIEETAACHILFVSQSEQGRMGEILPTLQGRSILTVGETNLFVRQGGIVAMRIAGNRIRLTINVEAAKAGRLTISSKVLRTAELVGTVSQ